MSVHPRLLRVVTAAARDGVGDTHVKVWRVRIAAQPAGVMTLDVASSLGRIRVDVPLRMIGTWSSLDVLRSDVARAVRRAVDEKQQRASEASSPDLIDHILGFREWRLADRRLAPVGYGVETWDGGNEVHAICGVSERLRRRTGVLAYMPERRVPAPGFVWHEAPDPECDCGLYAWHDMPGDTPAGSGVTRVLGAIVARGAVEVHQDGFRAQFARPVLFAYGGDDDREHVRALGRRHRVAVCAHADLRERALEFGRPVSDVVRP